MFKNNIQIEVCKALLNESRVCGTWINENEYAVTIDGVKLYVFNAKEIVFDTSKISQMDKIADIIKDAENDIEIIPTNCIEIYHGIMLRKYEAPATNLVVYIDANNIKPFADAKLYANAPTHRIIAKNHFGVTIGVIMPVAKRDEE